MEQWYWKFVQCSCLTNVRHPLCQFSYTKALYANDVSRARLFTRIFTRIYLNYRSILCGYKVHLHSKKNFIFLAQQDNKYNASIIHNIQIKYIYNLYTNINLTHITWTILYSHNDWSWQADKSSFGQLSTHLFSCNDSFHHNLH